MFSNNYREIDPSVPDGLIERMVDYGFVVAHPEKPRWIKATPKLETSVIKGIRREARKSRVDTIANYQGYPVMNWDRRDPSCCIVCWTSP